MGASRSQPNRRTGFLPAVVLWLVAALAAAYGPLTTAKPLGVQSLSVARSTGVPAQHSAPVAEDRSVIAAEWRGGRWAGLDDNGADDPGLPPTVAELVGPFRPAVADPSSFAAFSASAPDFFRARAPPHSA